MSTFNHLSPWRQDLSQMKVPVVESHSKISDFEFYLEKKL